MPKCPRRGARALLVRNGNPEKSAGNGKWDNRGTEMAQGPGASGIEKIRLKTADSRERSKGSPGLRKDRAKSNKCLHPGRLSPLRRAEIGQKVLTRDTRRRRFSPLRRAETRQKVLTRESRRRRFSPLRRAEIGQKVLTRETRRRRFLALAPGRNATKGIDSPDAPAQICDETRTKVLTDSRDATKGIDWNFALAPPRDQLPQAFFPKFPNSLPRAPLSSHFPRIPQLPAQGTALQPFSPNSPTPLPLPGDASTTEFPNFPPPLPLPRDSPNSRRTPIGFLAPFHSLLLLSFPLKRVFHKFPNNRLSQSQSSIPPPPDPSRSPKFPVLSPVICREFPTSEEISDHSPSLLRDLSMFSNVEQDSPYSPSRSREIP